MIVVDVFRINGRGPVATMDLDANAPLVGMSRDTSGPFDLIRERDGARWPVRGIERHVPALPYRAGEPIGVLLANDVDVKPGDVVRLVRRDP